MLLLSVEAKMLCLEANLIRAKALSPKAALLDWCAPGLRIDNCTERFMTFATVPASALALPPSVVMNVMKRSVFLKS